MPAPIGPPPGPMAPVLAVRTGPIGPVAGGQVDAHRRAHEPRRRGWSPPGAIGRHQPGPLHQPTQQRVRVDVDVAAPQPEVHVPGGHADGTARRDDVTGRQRRRRQPAVRRPQVIGGVRDHHVAGARHDPAERHRAARRGADDRARRGPVRHATVARAPRAPRFAERVDDRRRHRRQQARPRHLQRATQRSDQPRQRRQHQRPRDDHRPPLFLELLLDPDGGERAARERPRRQATPAAVIRARRWSTDLVWICGTRLSLTPSTRLIWASVRPSS